MDQHNLVNYSIHGVALSTIAGALWGAIPILAAIVAIVWYAIQIMESETYKKWSRRRHDKRIAKLKSRLIYLQAMSEKEL